MAQRGAASAQGAATAGAQVHLRCVDVLDEVTCWPSQLRSEDGQPTSIQLACGGTHVCRKAPKGWLKRLGATSSNFAL